VETGSGWAGWEGGIVPAGVWHHFVKSHSAKLQGNFGEPSGRAAQFCLH
jgi:hypothetical protein